MAAFSTTTLSAAAHSITAVYSGDANDLGSSSAVLTETVNLVATTTLLMSSANPSMFAQSITLTATVSPAAATGTVTFKDGANTLGTGALAGGTATFSTAALAMAAHSITAVYGGDSNDATSTSAVLTQTVNQATSTTTLMSSLNPSVFAQNVTFTATVSPAAATGTVTFKDGANTLGMGAANGGTATLSTAGLTAGQHSITAAYGGDANNAASVSAALNQQVNKASTTTTLTSSANPSLVGQQVTLRATIAPASATGMVTFNDGAAQLGSAVLNAGVATVTISPAFGSHSLTAAYAGDQNNASSVSAILTQSVTFNAITVLTTSLPNGIAGQPYGPFSLGASGGSGNFTWSGNGFPNGITVSQNGSVSGTPTAGFSGSVSVTATDTASAGQTASATFTLTITAAAVTISGAQSLGSFVAGAPITAAFTANGGQPPYTWSIAGAAVLAIDSTRWQGHRRRKHARELHSGDHGHRLRQRIGQPDAAALDIRPYNHRPAAGLDDKQLQRFPERGRWHAALHLHGFRATSRNHFRGRLILR